MSVLVPKLCLGTREQSHDPALPPQRGDRRSQGGARAAPAWGNDVAPTGRPVPRGRRTGTVGVTGVCFQVFIALLAPPLATTVALLGGKDRAVMGEPALRLVVELDNTPAPRRRNPCRDDAQLLTDTRTRLLLPPREQYSVELPFSQIEELIGGRPQLKPPRGMVVGRWERAAKPAVRAGSEPVSV